MNTSAVREKEDIQRRIVTLEKTLRSKDRHIARMKMTTTTTQQSLTTEWRKRTALEQTIQKKNQRIATLTEERKSARQRAATINRRLQEIYNSSSWAWMTAVRKNSVARSIFHTVRSFVSSPPYAGKISNDASTQHTAPDRFPTHANAQRLHASLAVVVVTHKPYLHFLKECLRSVEAQTIQPTELVLACDSCEPPSWVSRTRWNVIRGTWGNPNPARNAGIAHTTSEWIVFFDADNVMVPDYLEKMRAAIRAAPSHVGFIYPDIQYCDAKLQRTRLIKLRQWEYWDARNRLWFDTSSAWRRTAIEMVRGFNTTLSCFDDYNLVMATSRLGWKGKALGHPVLMREHGARLRRSTAGLVLNDGRREKAMWDIRSLGIVTVFAGRHHLAEDWMNVLQHVTLPPHASLYILDNSDSPTFHNLLHHFGKELSNRFARISITKFGEPYPINPDEPYLTWERMHHVATLYNHILPHVTDDLVAILEDDVVPPPDAFLRLTHSLMPDQGFGAVGAVYRSGEYPDHVCAAHAKDYWRDVPRFDAFPHMLVEVGFVGAGCTVYKNSALRKCLPVIPCTLRGHPTGWDGFLSYKLREHGYKIGCDGRVRCQHNAWGIPERQRNAHLTM